MKLESAVMQRAEKSRLSMETEPLEQTGADSAVTCKDMSDVRREIDRVDRAIVKLIAERQNYIEQAGHIKQSRDTVRDNDRVEDVVAKVRRECERQGANPDLLEELYRTMIEWCINYEFTVFDADKGR